jgi:pimeloyl-ACP methyl ester carboxylesterase
VSGYLQVPEVASSIKDLCSTEVNAAITNSDRRRTCLLSNGARVISSHACMARIPNFAERPHTRSTALLPLAVALLMAVVAAAQQIPAPRPPGKMVDIGGRKLHLNCTGRKSPTVLLEAGLGDSSLVWSLVQPKLAQLTRVCSYDRAGTAWSHDAGPPHSLSQDAEDLNVLLRASGEPAPYVVVGHSWGGWLVTVYATRHHGSVAGIVLVDSSVGFDPPVIENVPDGHTGGPPTGPVMLKKSTGHPDDPFKRLPAAAYKQYLWTESLPRFGDVDDPDEPLSTVQSATRGDFPLDDTPLVIIAARKADGAIDKDTKKGQAIRSKILKLSHQSTLVYSDSGHHVQLENPDAVVLAVRNVIDKTRRNARNK